MRKFSVSSTHRATILIRHITSARTNVRPLLGMPFRPAEYSPLGRPIPTSTHLISSATCSRPMGLNPQPGSSEHEGNYWNIWLRRNSATNVADDVDQMSPHGWWPRWAFYVWPTSYMLIANEGIMNTRGWTVTVVSAILNALIYILVGFIVYLALHAMRPSKR